MEKNKHFLGVIHLSLKETYKVNQMIHTPDMPVSLH